MSTPTLPAPTAAVPLLEDGQRLSRDEFERRYDAMPDLNKAELLEGVVYMGSPVSLDNHGEPHADLMTWLGFYKMFTPGVRSGDNASLRLDMNNEPQPDALLMIDPARGGRAQLEDGYVVGGPELVVEVSASSKSIDLGFKRRLYRQHGVQEYVVWRVNDGELDWFRLGQTDERLEASADGLYRSVVFPGLWLDAAALLRGDLAAVFRAVQAGAATAEHAAFVARLGGR